MPGLLVDDLVEAGLVSESQAREVAAHDPLSSARRVLERLVAGGLDERTLAGFFVSKGYGPMLQAGDLGRVDPELVHRLAAADAHELCAMPLRPSAAGAVVAMADPTDRAAIAKLSATFDGRVLPIVAKLSDLLEAIERAYPSERPTLVSDPIALTPARAPNSVMPWVGETEGDTGRTLDDMEPPAPRFASAASPEWDRAWSRSATERDVSITPLSSRIPLPVTSAPGAPSERPPPSIHPSIEGELTELRRVASRDEAVRVACRACLSMARGAAFLALRKGVFRGWDGAGEDVTSASIRSLWVPASNPSVLNEVLHSGKPFLGPYGQTAADHLFRAAFGSRGREIVVTPVLVGPRMVGALCANDPTAETEPFERVAEGLGHAFERLIVSKKTGPS